VSFPYPVNLPEKPADRWDSSLYEDRHSFVWERGADLIELLASQPGERILDLGCGTGQLTARIAERGADVIGLDSSPSMIAQARQNYPKLTFCLADARNFEFDSPFDAVFSNAALHWIKEAGSVVGSVAGSLRPGGRFVLEMGARHNVERIRSTLVEVLTEAGYSPQSPWFYPSPGEYATLLEANGFRVGALWNFERWTRLEHPERGLREWLEMFAGSFFEGVPEPIHQSTVSEVEKRLRPALWREGAWWADYYRLRVVAVRVV
jgi:trans-aconitate methyltransferase